MQFVITADYDEGTIENIDRGLKFLFLTREGTVPLNRDFGLSQNYIDTAAPYAVNQLAAELPDKLQIYEPRVQLDHIETRYDAKTGRSESVVYFKQSTDNTEETEEVSEDE